MENEKETKRRLSECAMKEFSEKGYMKASLRNICKEAGVTTGALYFFFKDKEDLFGSLIGDTLSGLEQIIGEHFSEEISASMELTGTDMTPADLARIEGFDDDMAVAKQVVRFLFAKREVFDLLLTKSQGSKYEDYPDRMVERIEAHYTKLFAIMRNYSSLDELTVEDRFIIHWMSHDQIDIFIHIVTHCGSEQEALKQMVNMVTYMIGGWYAVVKNKQ